MVAERVAAARPSSLVRVWSHPTLLLPSPSQTMSAAYAPSMVHNQHAQNADTIVMAVALLAAAQKFAPLGYEAGKIVWRKPFGNRSDEEKFWHKWNGNNRRRPAMPLQSQLLGALQIHPGAYTTISTSRRMHKKLYCHNQYNHDHRGQWRYKYKVSKQV